jgi:rhodanese-related sulfurtransferase
MRPMRLFAQCAAIVLLGSGLGLLLNSASGRPARLREAIYPAAASGIAACSSTPQGLHALHGHPEMPLAEAFEACKGCTVGFVDARSASAFAQGHISGAHHLPPAGHRGEAELLKKLRRYKTLVVYDGGGSCALAEGMADRLEAEGFKDVRLLKGFADWAAAGGPAQSGACHACEEHADGPGNLGEGAR